MKTPTFKKYTTLAFVAEAAFAVVCIVGWFLHLENPVGMMNCDAMAFIGTMAVYGGKSGFEHSQWATPLVAGIASGLTSSDPAAGIQNAMSAYQSQKQMEMMTSEAGMAAYNDSSVAPPPENMPADGAPQEENISQPSGTVPQ